MRGVAMSSDHSALMPLVLVESPYAGDAAANVDYASLCLRDALSRSEAPIAVECHSQLTQPTVLDDDIPDHRTLGIDAGLAWLRAADASVVYKGRSISSDMFLGIETARCAGVPVEFRRFDGYVTPDVTALDPHAPRARTCGECGACTPASGLVMHLLFGVVVALSLLGHGANDAA
jgi:hypothetical protein